MTRPRILVLGTLDTKGEEFEFLRDQLGDTTRTTGVGAEIDGDGVHQICFTSMLRIWTR